MPAASTSPQVPSLVAFDLDGTTIEFGSQDLHPRVQAAIERAHDLGARTAVVSGRPLHMLRPLQAHPWVDWLITMNGSLILRSDNEKVLFAQALPHADVLASFDAVVDLDPGLGVITRRGLFQERRMLNYMIQESAPDGSDQTVDVDAILEQFPGATRVASAPAFVASSGEEVYKIQMSFPNPEVRDLAHARLAALGSYEIADMGVMEVEVTAAGVNKGTGLDRLCTLAGIDPTRAVAFGDSGNDMDMAGHVGTLVAVGNATDGFKAVADETCPPIWEQGVAQWLEAHLG